MDTLSPENIEFIEGQKNTIQKSLNRLNKELNGTKVLSPVIRVAREKEREGVRRLLSTFAAGHIPALVQKQLDLLRKKPYPDFSRIDDITKEGLFHLSNMLEGHPNGIKNEDKLKFSHKVKVMYNLPDEISFEDAKYLVICDSKFGMIIEDLKREYTENYAIYMNMGSAMELGQLVPQDISFKENILKKYPKHLFLIWDKTIHPGVKEMFSLPESSENGKKVHKMITAPLEEFLGTRVQYRKISDFCFSYTFISDLPENPQEVKLVFFNEYIYNITLHTLFNSLIKNASLSIFMCMMSYSLRMENEGCDTFIYKNIPYVFEHFDFYMINPYSKYPIYTYKGEGRKRRVYDPTTNTLVDIPFNINVSNNTEIQPYPIINLKELRKHNITEVIPERVITHTNLSGRIVEHRGYMFIPEKLHNLHIPFKIKGDPTYWNIVGGSKGRTKKKRVLTKRPKKYTRKN